MAAMMWVGSRRHQMGRFTVHPITLALGWVATIIMALAAFTMLIV
jgi:Mn2+/Fe2+ NRAMP family transporter